MLLPSHIKHYLPTIDAMGNFISSDVGGAKAYLACSSIRKTGGSIDSEGNFMQRSPWVTAALEIGQPSAQKCVEGRHRSTKSKYVQGDKQVLAFKGSLKITPESRVNESESTSGAAGFDNLIHLVAQVQKHIWS